MQIKKEYKFVVSRRRRRTRRIIHYNKYQGLMTNRRIHTSLRSYAIRGNYLISRRHRRLAQNYFTPSGGRRAQSYTSSLRFLRSLRETIKVESPEADARKAIR